MQARLLFTSIPRSRSRLVPVIGFALVILSSRVGAQTIERINPEGMTQPTAYHHVIKAGNLLFIAGQVALSADGELVGASDMPAQLKQVLENLKTVLSSQDADFSNVVKINIFTTDIEAFRSPASASVRESYFRGNPPASTLVQIERLARPEFLVEIEAVAVIDE